MPFAEDFDKNDSDEIQTTESPVFHRNRRKINMKLDGAWTFITRRRATICRCVLIRLRAAAWRASRRRFPAMLRSILCAPGLEQNPFYGETSTTSANMNTITGGIRRNSACPTALGGADGATLHGVNTIAEVFVNDTLVGKCDDMMIEHRFRGKSAAPW